MILIPIVIPEEAFEGAHPDSRKVGARAADFLECLWRCLTFQAYEASGTFRVTDTRWYQDYLNLTIFP
jgi:hypothetical protein